MGLALSTATFADWVEGRVPFRKWQSFASKLKKKTGLSEGQMNWKATNLGYEKVGSYTSYGVFVGYLEFLTEGDYEGTLDDEDNVEKEALACFKKSLQPATLKIPLAKHFTRTGDCDTIFIPTAFDEPLEFPDAYVASLPRAVDALAALADKAKFSIDAEYEDEYINEKWDAIVTAKNISRTIYKYFSKASKRKTCVAFA